MISHFFTRPFAEARLPWQPSTTAPSAIIIFITFPSCSEKSTDVHRESFKKEDEKGRVKKREIIFLHALLD